MECLELMDLLERTASQVEMPQQMRSHEQKISASTVQPALLDHQASWVPKVLVALLENVEGIRQRLFRDLRDHLVQWDHQACLE